MFLPYHLKSQKTAQQYDYGFITDYNKWWLVCT